VGALLVAGLLVVLTAAPARGHEFCAPTSFSGPGPILVPPPADDWDCDFVKDDVDNCPPTGYDDLTHRNPDQANADGDARGDWCDNDDDNDTVLDWADGGYDYQPNRVKKDNCRIVANLDQTDVAPKNGVGDACQDDEDRDGVFDTEDNCREDANPDQADMDGDRNGDVCDNDVDGDFVRNSADNCPALANPQVPPDWIQPDADADGIGDACEPPPPVPTVTPAPTPAPTPRPESRVDVNDRQAPRVTVRLSSTQRRDEIEGGLVVRVRCSEACAVKADLVASRKVAKRLKLRRVVASGTAKVEAAGTTYAFVRLSSRTRRAVFKAKRTPLTLRVAVTDPSGNTRRESQRVTFVR
jgi:hypothetical protein